MLRLHIRDKTISMAAHGMDELILRPCFPQKLRRLDAVLLRIHLKVNIVQQAGDSPKILLLPISLVLGKPTHHAFHGKGVKDVERFLIIFFQGL